MTQQFKLIVYFPSDATTPNADGETGLDRMLLRAPKHIQRQLEKVALLRFQVVGSQNEAEQLRRLSVIEGHLQRALATVHDRDWITQDHLVARTMELVQQEVDLLADLHGIVIEYAAPLRVDSQYDVDDGSRFRVGPSAGLLNLSGDWNVFPDILPHPWASVEQFTWHPKGGGIIPNNIIEQIQRPMMARWPLEYINWYERDWNTWGGPGPQPLHHFGWVNRADPDPSYPTHNPGNGQPIQVPTVAYVAENGQIVKKTFPNGTIREIGRSSGVAGVCAMGGERWYGAWGSGYDNPLGMAMTVTNPDGSTSLVYDGIRHPEFAREGIGFFGMELVVAPSLTGFPALSHYFTAGWAPYEGPPIAPGQNLDKVHEPGGIHELGHTKSMLIHDGDQILKWPSDFAFHPRSGVTQPQRTTAFNQSILVGGETGYSPLLQGQIGELVAGNYERIVELRPQPPLLTVELDAPTRRLHVGSPVRHIKWPDAGQVRLFRNGAEVARWPVRAADHAVFGPALDPPPYAVPAEGGDFNAQLFYGVNRHGFGADGVGMLYETAVLHVDGVVTPPPGGGGGTRVLEDIILVIGGETPTEITLNRGDKMPFVVEGEYSDGSSEALAATVQSSAPSKVRVRNNTLEALKKTPGGSSVTVQAQYGAATDALIVRVR